jgi:outer membrane protein assembly factor BamB
MKIPIHFAAIALLLASAPAFGADWPEWRNANRNAASDEKISSDWTAKPPKRLWSKALGGALGYECYSSVSVVNDKAYTLAYDPYSKADVVFCLNAATGAEIWKFSYSSPVTGTRATPNVNNGVVYSVSATGNVVALDAATGVKLWSRDLGLTLNVDAHHLGVCGSPVVDGNNLIINATTEGVAINKTTGAVIWRNAAGLNGIGTPVPFIAGDGTHGQMLFTATALTAVNPATGTRLWSTPWGPSFDQRNISDPIVVGDKVFISSLFGMGCAVYQFTGSSVTQVWTNQNMSNYWTTSVLKSGCLYGQSDQGQMLQCVDYATGALKWSQALDHGFTHIMVDGKLLLVMGNGDLRLADVSPTAYTQIGSVAGAFPLGQWDELDSPPSFSNGRIFVRSAQGTVTCLDISPPPSAVVYGDANSDGGFSLADINQMVDWLLSRTAPPAPGSARFTACDVNGDGVLSLADLNLYVDKMLGRITKFPIEP